jgi:hypothetical protein
MIIYGSVLFLVILHYFIEILICQEMYICITVVYFMSITVPCL